MSNFQWTLILRFMGLVIRLMTAETRALEYLDSCDVFLKDVTSAAEAPDLRKEKKT